MSFDIHVSAVGVGAAHFVFRKSGVPDGVEWDLDKVQKQVLKKAGIKGGPSSPTAGATKHAMDAMSRLAQIHIFTTILETMMLKHGRGSLFMSITKEHTLWSDTVKNCNIMLDGISGGGPPCSDLLTFLDENDMNGWGHISAIQAAIDEFYMVYNGKKNTYSIMCYLTA